MANSKQSKKRAIQAEKRRLSNKWQLTRMRTSLKKVISLAGEGNLDEARKTYDEAASYLDRLANKGMIAKNKASRHKSRMVALMKRQSAA